VKASRTVSVAMTAGVLGLALGCGGSNGASSTGLSLTGSVDVAKDVAMKENLRNLANCEESFFTDAGSYGAVAQVTADCPATQLPAGEVVTVHLANATGFCLAGQVGAGRYWIYDSTQGGLRGPTASDTCNVSIFTKAGGTLGH